MGVRIRVRVRVRGRVRARVRARFRARVRVSSLNTRDYGRNDGEVLLRYG